MDDYGEETGLTREMKAAADAGPTRSDTDTMWRRGGGGGGGGGGASERPRAFGSRGGAGADAIRQAMRGGGACLLYTSPSPRDQRGSRMPSSA